MFLHMITMMGLKYETSLMLFEKNMKLERKRLFCICLNGCQTMTDLNKITKIFFNILFTDHIYNEIIIDDLRFLRARRKV